MNLRKDVKIDFSDYLINVKLKDPDETVETIKEAIEQQLVIGEYAKYGQPDYLAKMDNVKVVPVIIEVC